jgi:molybdopterin-guanine dinucleotide biosynthesis protein MobB
VDKPGTDSDFHRRAGAAPAVFQTATGIGVYWNHDDARTEEMLKTVFNGCDIVVVESFRKAKGPKLLITDDVHESGHIENVIGIISETSKKNTRPLFKPGSIKIIDFIEKKFFNKISD